jgi:hypothetical protein
MDTYKLTLEDGTTRTYTVSSLEDLDDDIIEELALEDGIISEDDTVVKVERLT